RLLVHDVRRHDEVVVAPFHDPDVVAEANRLPAVVDPREDFDRSALADIGEPRHERSGWALAVRRLRARGRSGRPASLRRRRPGLSGSAVGYRPDREDRDDDEDDADQEEVAPEAARRTPGGSDRDVAPHVREVVAGARGAVA